MQSHRLEKRSERTAISSQFGLEITLRVQNAGGCRLSYEADLRECTARVFAVR